MTKHSAGVSERKSSRQPSKSAPRRIGYARVSTKAQDMERQIRALKAERVDEIFKDTASGKSLAGRPQLTKALDSLAPGDELVIAEWDRATHRCGMACRSSRRSSTRTPPSACSTA